MRLTIGAASTHGRAYVLLEGATGTDPVELESRLPEAHWYSEAIIALEIEPVPADALPMLVTALGGQGAPAGVTCELLNGRAIVEIHPSLTQAALVIRIADVELRRLNAARRTRLLAPLPLHVLTQIAAAGLQTPEIAPERVLEALLENTRVE